jgi:chromatin segregation and condensation protein Rec8/ScpA/Scc1 (kleisin family)
VERLQRDGREKFLARRRRPPTPEELRERLKELEVEVRRILATQDAEGRWIEDGEIHSRTFIRYVETLADYLATLQALKR